MNDNVKLIEEIERKIKMSLKICDVGHEEICYRHNMYEDCPICKLQKELEDRIEELEDRIQELENQIEEFGEE